MFLLATAPQAPFLCRTTVDAPESGVEGSRFGLAVEVGRIGFGQGDQNVDGQYGQASRHGWRDVKKKMRNTYEKGRSGIMCITYVYISKIYMYIYIPKRISTGRGGSGQNVTPSACLLRRWCLRNERHFSAHSFDVIDHLLPFCSFLGRSWYENRKYGVCMYECMPAARGCILRCLCNERTIPDRTHID